MPDWSLVAGLAMFVLFGFVTFLAERSTKKAVDKARSDTPSRDWLGPATGSETSHLLARALERSMARASESGSGHMLHLLGPSGSGDALRLFIPPDPAPEAYAIKVARLSELVRRVAHGETVHEISSWTGQPETEIRAELEDAASILALLPMQPTGERPVVSGD